MSLSDWVVTLLKTIALRYIRVLFNLYANYFERDAKGRIPAITDGLLTKPAVVIADNVRRGKVKSKDVVEAYLKRIEKVDPLIKAVVDTNRKAKEEAEAIDEKVRLELERKEKESKESKIVKDVKEIKNKVNEAVDSAKDKVSGAVDSVTDTIKGFGFGGKGKEGEEGKDGEDGKEGEEGEEGEDSKEGKEDKASDNRKRTDEAKSGDSIDDMPLIGVPVSIKDLIAVKGLLLTCGLYERKNTVATEDSEIVANLRKAGAIPIVITNTPEFFTSYDTDTVLTGYTNNPYDLSRSPGGSSGGEGALLASGGSIVGIGSDVGGSVRIPGMFCGVFGHKPTPSVISNKGLFPEIKEAISKLFVTGPMCRFASDLIPTLKAMAGEDISKLPLIDEEVDLHKVRIFYMFDDKDPLKTPLDGEIKECVKKVVAHFEEKFGVECVEVDFEEFAVANEVWSKIVAKEVVTEYMQYLRGKNLYVEFLKSFLRLSRHTKRGLLFAIMSQFVGSEVTEDEKSTVKKLRQKYDNLLGTNGVFISPTHPETAPKRPLTLLNIINCGYTMPHNVLEAPATHCPMGLNKAGLPIGVQVAASANNDHLTIAIAKEIENAFHGWVPPCQINC